MKRILIAAPKSGSGKTIFTCGLLNILKTMGTVSSFKCGPDYIDPMFHRTVIGIEGSNLDPYFCDKEEVRSIMSRSGTEFAVLEGAMGIYDGIGGMGKRGSCYEIAQMTDTSIILVVDAKGMGRTMLSIINGILADDESRLIKGIILNRISRDYFERIRDELNSFVPEVAILGCIPNDSRISLDSRHLGLKMPEEVGNLMAQVAVFSELIKENCDLEGIFSIMDSASDIEIAPAVETPREEHALRLAVARDEAFCFYYPENLRAFTDRGVSIIEFSPLRDKELPPNIHGLLLGGGYPELMAAELSANLRMRESIREAIESGLPSLAECGGFMYLMDEIESEGIVYPMVGIIPGLSKNQGSLTRFGYVEIISEKSGLLLQGETVRGHEFHYFDSSNNGEDCIATKPNGKASWSCIHMSDNHMWGYPHIYYPSNINLVERFVSEMNKVKKEMG